MSNLTHLFKVGQKVKCSMDGELYKGTVKETYTDHIIVDIPEISDHCCFENGFNIGDVYPEYNMIGGGFDGSIIDEWKECNGLLGTDNVWNGIAH